MIHGGRFPILTKKGLLYLGCLPLVPVLSLVFSWSLTSSMIIIALLLVYFLFHLANDYILARSNFKRLRIKATPPKYLTATIASTLQIRFKGLKRKKDIFLHCSLSEPYGTTCENNIYKINPAYPGFSHHFIPLKRGKIVFDHVTIRLGRKGGYYLWQAKYNLNKLSITSYPNQSLLIPQPEGTRQNLFAGNDFFKISGGSGREFDTLRKYTRYDDVRFIDWKRSAKAGKMLIREYKPESNQRLYFVLDCSRKMNGVSNSRSHLDNNIDVIASITNVAINAGDEVGLFCFDDSVKVQMPASKHRRHEQEILRELTNLEVGNFDADYSLLSQWASTLQRRSLIIVLSNIYNKSNLELITSQLKQIATRHSILLACAEDPSLNEMAHKPALDIKQAYTTAAAWQQVSSILSYLDEINDYGINSVFVSSTLLAKRLTEKYYRLKYLGKV